MLVQYTVQEINAKDVSSQEVELTWCELTSYADVNQFLADQCLVDEFGFLV